MKRVPAGPVSGLLAQVLLIASLAGAAGAGHSRAGWAVGFSSALVVDGALARGLARHGSGRLRPADRVTLARATLAVGVAALIADSFHRSISVALLVSLSAVALALDAVDGWVARRTRTAAPLGARFDAEVDAFLILVLSVYVAATIAPWALAIGLARYAFGIGGWALPWLSAPLPPRFWRKVVAATQGVVLTVVAADVLPRNIALAALLVAFVLLAESFGRDVWWLWRRRQGGARAGAAIALSVLALLVVWGALVAPHEPSRVTPGAFARLPVELLVVVALAAVLPAAPRRGLAVVAGALLGALLVVKVLDIGFFTAYDRPFRPVDDWSYAGIGIETLRDTIGRSHGNLVVAVLAAGIMSALVLPAAALLRVTRVAAARRSWALAAAATLGVVWVVLRVAGAPAASASAAALAIDEVRAVRIGLQGHAILAREIARDRFRATPPDRLLTGLRGKDVVVLFVESYGKVAVQGSSFSPGVDSVLARGTAQLKAAGFSARSAFLESPTFGGLSWLAHSTLQAGLRIDTQRRYDQLMQSNRFTLSQAFGRVGWRTVDVVPSNDRTWTAGTGFYHYDKVYDRRNVGYHGPGFAYASMPDQYVLLALHRLELARRQRRPLFAEVDLVSSHVPWTRIPPLIPWDAVGDGSVFRRLPAGTLSESALFSDRNRTRAAYGRSIRYTLSAIVSFVRRYGDRNLVLVVLGDHQPDTIVTGQGAGHEVPVSLIAHDPAVLRRIAGWRWGQGLRPGTRAPVWPMSAFRDRFLTAFSR